MGQEGFARAPVGEKEYLGVWGGCNSLTNLPAVFQ